MKINKKYFGFFAILVAFIAIGSAWNLLGAVQVDHNSCIDSDHGLNFTRMGFTNFTINQTYYSLTDYCFNNTVVYEFACSNDVPSLNVSDYAIVASEDCKAVFGSNATCYNGACRP
jgi:hypothetical protein